MLKNIIETICALVCSNLGIVLGIGTMLFTVLFGISSLPVLYVIVCSIIVAELKIIGYFDVEDSEEIEEV